MRSAPRSTRRRRRSSWPASEPAATIGSVPTQPEVCVPTSDLIAAVIVVAVMLLIAFPIHEFAHALAAYRLGDGTAKMFGRLTLNPFAHFDPIGGILLAVSVLASGGRFGFGWAKPTPVNPTNLRNGRY